MFVNLTPHDIHIIARSGVIRTIEKSGQVARCAESITDIGTIDGVAITRTVFGEVTGLPDPIDGTVFIVSMAIRSALPDRTDLASPGKIVRDENGVIVGCQSLNM